MRILFFVVAVLVPLTSAFAQFDKTQKLRPDPAGPSRTAGIVADLYEGVGVLGAPFEGAAYVYERIGGTWWQTARLSVPAPEEFGKAVSVSPNTIAVGEPADDIVSFNSGSVRIFEKVQGQWLETAFLYPEDTSQLDNFGTSLALSGSRFIAGAKYDDDRGNSTGSAYIFSKNNGTWEETAKLVADDAREGDLAGWSVALEGNIAVVGAWANSRRGLFAGTAYVFEDTEAGWVQTATLFASDAAAEDYFGVSVAVFDQTIVVGATGEGGGRTGAAYIFDRLGNGWVQTAKVTGSGTGGSAEFGTSLAGQGNVLLVGAQGHRGPGAVFAFKRGIQGWVQFDRIDPENSFASGFGRGLGYSGYEVLVGAPWDSQDGTSAGAGYMFLGPVGQILKNRSLK